MYGEPQRRIRQSVKAFLGTALLFAVPGFLQANSSNGDQDTIPAIRTVLGTGHGVDLDAEERQAAQALGQAVAALEAGDLVTSRRHLDQASEAGPIADYVEWVRIRWLIAHGDNGQASKQALQLAGISSPTPLRAEFYRLAGEAFAQEGKWINAQSAWESALALTSDPAGRRSLEASLALARSAAPPSFLPNLQPSAEPTVAQRLPRRSPEAALASANAQVEEGRGAQAVESFREALAGGLQPPAVAEARLKLGIALFRLRRYDEALPVFEQMGLNSEGRFWRARTLARLGRVEESITGFEALAGTETGTVALQSAYLVATLLEGRGESLRAMAHYRRVASDSPDQDRAVAALWRLGWSAWKRGDFADARMYFSEMALRSTDESSRLQARYWKARASERLGRKDASRLEFESIASDWPLSYYGWRAQTRLGRLSPLWQRAKEDRVEGKIGGSAQALSEASAVRIALLTEAGLLPQARSELTANLGPVSGSAEKVRVGRLLIAAEDYHGAQQLVIEGGGMALAQGVRTGEESIFWLAWPAAYPALVEASLQNLDGVDPFLVWAIMREESGFRPRVMSSAGAMGLLQLMPNTARLQAERSGLPMLDEDERLFEPPVNIALGSAYLDYLFERFPARPSAMIASYNAGPNAVARWSFAKSEDDEWVENIPYVQTRRYVKRVLRSLYVYQALYGPESPLSIAIE